MEGNGGIIKIMKHLKTFLIEKEWDKVNQVSQGEFVANIPGREKKIVVGYNTLEKAQEFCVIMNKECKNCPRRAALHTTYKVLENPIHVRIVTADDTYESKMRDNNRPS